MFWEGQNCRNKMRNCQMRRVSLTVPPSWLLCRNNPTVHWVFNHGAQHVNDFDNRSALCLDYLVLDVRIYADVTLWDEKFIILPSLSLTAFDSIARDIFNLSTIIVEIRTRTTWSSGQLNVEIIQDYSTLGILTEDLVRRVPVSESEIESMATRCYGDNKSWKWCSDSGGDWQIFFPPNPKSAILTFFRNWQA
uniref:Uncharacterized protein n=1 Tax=Strigamia maritima TaxID=126957 RepID=T1JJD5_STRMM